MRLTVGKIFVLENDYQEMLVQNGAEVYGQYSQLKFAERTIGQVHHEDIYIIEPKRYYYIEFKEDVLKIINEKHHEIASNKKLFKYFVEHIDVIVDKLLFIGILYHVDLMHNRMYIYNCGENIIYIRNKTKVCEVDL